MWQAGNVVLKGCMKGIAVACLSLLLHLVMLRLMHAGVLLQVLLLGLQVRLGHLLLREGIVVVVVLNAVQRARVTAVRVRTPFRHQIHAGCCRRHIAVTSCRTRKQLLSCVRP